MPKKKKHREENDDRGDRGDQNRHGDFLRGAEHGIAPVLAEREMPVDVLQLDDGIVDEPADAERKTAQGKDVERLAGEIKKHEGCHDRERDGHGHDGGRAQAHEENENHDHREKAALHGLVLQGAHGRTDVARLVERDGELHVLGHTAKPWKRGLHGVDDADGVGPGLLEHAQIDAALAIDAHDLRLIGRAVFDPGHVGYAHRRRGLPRGLRRPGAHHDLAERACLGKLRVREDVVVAIARAQAAARQEKVRRAHRADYVENAEAARPQGIAVRLDLDLANLSASDARAGHTGDSF